MKNIVITGAGKGIGYYTSLKLLENNFNVIAISRNIERLKSIKSKNLFPISLDITSYNYEPIKNILQNLGKVHILINNAGVLVNKPFLEQSFEDINSQLSVNFIAPVRILQELFPYFTEGTHIVNISSIGGFQGSVKFPGLSIYSATKGALNTLTEALAEEWKKYKVYVNSLCLGAVQTEMLEKAFPGYKAPLSPEQMAEFIAYFAINGNKFFNGKVIPVSLSTP